MNKLYIHSDKFTEIPAIGNISFQTLSTNFTEYYLT
jgi:hypothetical protein